jgi:tRNA threonylcarbamoyladenosine biosynthesis protein TsaE
MPILEGQSLEFVSHSPEQTQRLGVRIGEVLEPGFLVCLAGDLGSGKTTLTQGIARGWGSLDPVTSPSFILINEYQRADRQTLYHLDAFRLKDAGEALFLGLEDLLESGSPMVVEWPERILSALPEERLWIDMHWVDELRRGLQLQATGIRYERMLDRFRQLAFGG